MKKKIGIIGNGFVGNSIAFGFSPTHEIRIHDKDPKRNLNTIEEVLECDFVFVAVPTPMDEKGAISLDVVVKALGEVHEKNKRTDILKESLQSLLNDDVEILPQTMPPFPWHFGGQQFHNLFLDGEWINAFCADTGVRVCLDISHSALECTYKKKSFSQFLDDVMPHTAHLHLADALGVDGEGLQIGAGSVDWGLVSSKMREHCEGASWIPEIWQGHENSGQGFWISLNELERFGF